jgi:hypothetical protein
MRLTIPTNLDGLADYVLPFIDLVGGDRWFKRTDHLDLEQRRSPNRWKIVADYHWLEMAITFQADVLDKEGRLRPDLLDASILASLNFAATTIEVHRCLSRKGKLVLAGRLRDALKAENGFAPLYLELDLAQRLMNSGYEVAFVDMEGEAHFDLLFTRGQFTGEVECKSLSADAGRQIHRKDFYRFMEALAPALAAQAALKKREVLLITLDGRLSPNVVDQAELLARTTASLEKDAPPFVKGPGFTLGRSPFERSFGTVSINDQRAFYKACGGAFGPNTHVAGGLTDDRGCIVVMRSLREDDTSKPLLEAMRKAADQFSRQRPAFIAIQEHGIEAADLMLPHLRRRVGILSYALFRRYGANHVNATCVTGFGALVAKDGTFGTPAFAVPNPAPKFPLSATEAAPFLEGLPDHEYAEAIGALQPAPERAVDRAVGPHQNLI